MLIFTGDLPSLIDLSGKERLDINVTKVRGTEYIQVEASNTRGWEYADHQISEALYRESKVRVNDKLVQRWYRRSFITDSVPQLILENSIDTLLYNAHTKLVIREKPNHLELTLARFVSDSLKPKQENTDLILVENTSFSKLEISVHSVKRELEIARLEAVPGISVKSDRFRKLVRFFLKNLPLDEWQHRSMSLLYGVLN